MTSDIISIFCGILISGILLNVLKLSNKKYQYQSFSLNMESGIFYMPRGQLTKEEMKYQVLKLKEKLQNEQITYTSDPKALADQYLNMVLDKISEYTR